MAGDNNLSNVKFEDISNPFFGNQFIPYFIKIPQVGHYAETNSKELKARYVDRINEVIRGVTIPETSNTFVPVSYFGHQNAQYSGVGSGELGTISVRMKLDRYMNCYASFLTWSYMVYDWTAGGVHNKTGIMSQDELNGIIYVEFLDSEENRTRKMKYKVIIETVPPLTLGVDTPEEMDIEITFKVTDIDPTEFLVSDTLLEPVKL
jgi:hypothetical protein